MGTALAAVIASPAFAQSYDPSVGSGNIVPPLSQPNPMIGGASTQAYSGGGNAAFAYEPERGYGYSSYARDPATRHIDRYRDNRRQY
jgi:hypothetical protein